MAVPAITVAHPACYPRPLLLGLDAFRTPDLIVNGLGSPSPATTLDLIHVARRVIGQVVRLQCTHGSEPLACEAARQTFLDPQFQADGVSIRQQALMTLRPPCTSFVAGGIDQASANQIIYTGEGSGRRRTARLGERPFRLARERNRANAELDMGNIGE